MLTIEELGLFIYLEGQQQLSDYDVSNNALSILVEEDVLESLTKSRGVVQCNLCHF